MNCSFQTLIFGSVGMTNVFKISRKQFHNSSTLITSNLTSSGQLVQFVSMFVYYINIEILRSCTDAHTYVYACMDVLCEYVNVCYIFSYVGALVRVKLNVGAKLVLFASSSSSSSDSALQRQRHCHRNHHGHRREDTSQWYACNITASKIYWRTNTNDITMIGTTVLSNRLHIEHPHPVHLGQMQCVCA